MWIGLGISLPSQAPLWTPASLFAAGEQGLWLDPSQIATLTQDSAGATPVTAAGQPVGRVRDVSGRGNHALQTVSASRPTYQVDGGGRAYLATDGVDDVLTTASVAWGADEVTVVAAIMRNQTANSEDVIGLGPNATVTNGTWVVAATVDAASDNSGIASKGTTSLVIARAGGVLTGTPWVITGQSKIADDICAVRRNGVPVLTTTTDQGTGTYVDGALTIAGRSNGFRRFNGRIYGLIAINRVLTAPEMAQAEAWAAAKCGVTL